MEKSKSKINVQDLKDLDFDILKEGDLSHIRGGILAPVDPGKPASKDATSVTLPGACDVTS